MDAVKYQGLKDVYDEFLSEKRLKEMYHKYNSQKNEAMNQKIARVCPKNKTYSKTMLLSDRVDWCVIEDSIGGKAAIDALYKDLGLGVPMKELLEYYSKSDRTREYYRKHAAKPSTKANRRAAKNDAFQKDREDQSRARARGLDYGAAIGYNATMTNQVSATEPQMTPTHHHSVEPSTQLVCKRCGQHGHRDARSKVCIHHNGRRKQYQG